MLDLFGRGYVFEHILAELKRERDLFSFKVYVTDALMALNDNLTSFIGGGTTITARWAELVSKDTETDTRTGEEIAADVIEKAGLILDERRETDERI